MKPPPPKKKDFLDGPQTEDGRGPSPNSDVNQSSRLTAA